MTLALDHAQGWTPAGLGKPVTRHGMPASVIAHGKFQKHRVFSSLPVARTEKLRATCRGRQRSPGLFFTPRFTDLSEIHELRICELTGRQAVLSRALLDTGHHVIHDSFDGPKRHSNRLSCGASVVKQPIERTFTREQVPFASGATSV